MYSDYTLCRPSFSNVPWRVHCSALSCPFHLCIFFTCRHLSLSHHIIILYCAPSSLSTLVPPSSPPIHPPNSLPSSLPLFLRPSTSRRPLPLSQQVPRPLTSPRSQPLLPVVLVAVVVQWQRSGTIQTLKTTCRGRTRQLACGSGTRRGISPLTSL